MKINEIKYGFKLISIEQIDDINATLYQYEHLKSGGKVAYLANDDTNCCFAIGFKTLPEDSTGVCHIIEHSLLCGSKKFPLKEPFVNLIKSSLATFLNAFTAYDWTMYPFASQTPKDFNNILDIYLDAVFNPLSMVDERPFLQEGWHLELLDENATPSYKGVVYNEMKGAMSSVDEVLVQSTLEAMYKDTFYRFNSGGEPDDIVKLTYQQYKDFYHKHYTPQNAFTYFYGKMDIEEKLKFLDEQYFHNFDKKENGIIIEPQKPFIDLSYEKEYEIGKEEETKDNTYMSLCYGLDHYNHYEDLMAMNVLCDALLSKNDSPLKKALLEANLAQNVECRIDDDNIIPALHIYLQKTNPNKKEEFKQVFEEKVRELVEKGIDKDLLLASINHLEFKDKELDVGGTPKGLLFAMIMMGSFNYDGALSSHLEFSKYYHKFRQEIDNHYFEKILEKYILNSKHCVQVVLKPSKTLGEQKQKEMDEKMKHLKETMSQEEKKRLVLQTKNLLDYQNHTDTKEELATLPSLKRKDIPNTINFLESKKCNVNGMKGFMHPVNTNKIAYLRMYFDLKTISFDDLPYVLLLKSLFLNVATTHYSISELTNQVKTYLGDLSFSELAMSSSKDDLKAYFKVSASALNENVNYIPTLIQEILLHSKFTKKEVLQVAKQLANDLKQQIISNGMNVAMAMARSSFSKEGSFTIHALKGPKVFAFFNHLIKNYNHREVLLKLNDISKALFNKQNVTLSLSGDEQTIDLLKLAIRKIKLPRKSYDIALSIPYSTASKCALTIPSGVSYNALCSNLEDYNEKFNGKYLVLAHIVSYDYLWAEIRVKGGAYGSGLSIMKNNDFVLGTYRDPNVKNSYEIFKSLPEYLRKFKVSKDEFLSYIIGTMGNFDSPLSTPSLINVWDINYLKGYRKNDKMKLKKEVLKTSLKDIQDCADLIEKMIANSSEYTIGNDVKIKEYSFDDIQNL